MYAKPVFSHGTPSLPLLAQYRVSAEIMCNQSMNSYSRFPQNSSRKGHIDIQSVLKGLESVKYH